MSKNHIKMFYQTWNALVLNWNAVDSGIFNILISGGTKSRNENLAFRKIGFLIGHAFGDVIIYVPKDAN